MELSLASSSVSSLLLLVLSVAYVYHTTCRRRNQSPSLRLPPSPPGWPVIGHLHLLSGMPHHALAELSRRMRAPLLRLRLGTVPAVVISSPALARAALTTHDAALSSRPRLLSGEALSFGCSDVTYAPSGPYHRAARRVLFSELLSSRRVEARAGERAGEVRRRLARLARRVSWTWAIKWACKWAVKISTRDMLQMDTKNSEEGIEQNQNDVVVFLPVILSLLYLLLSLTLNLDSC